jgi:hypothetical protein
MADCMPASHVRPTVARDLMTAYSKNVMPSKFVNQLRDGMHTEFDFSGHYSSINSAEVFNVFRSYLRLWSDPASRRSHEYSILNLCL